MESTNPYAAPEAELEIHPQLTPGTFDIRSCFDQAWKACWANFPLWLGVGIVGFLLMFVSAITIIGYIVVLPVIAWGGVAFTLNMLKGTAEFNDLFVGFKSYGKALGRMLMLIVVGFLFSLIIQSVSLIGQMQMSSALTTIGSIINIIGSLFMLRFYFCYFLVVDKDLPAIESIGQSWNITKGLFLKLFLLGLTSVGIAILGILALGIGIIPATTIIYLMWTAAYRQVVGN